MFQNFSRKAHRLDENIKMDVKEVGWEGMNWSHVAQGGD
jgi:hypothetical protein